MTTTKKYMIAKIASWYTKWASSLDSAGKDSTDAQARLADVKVIIAFHLVLSLMEEVGTLADMLKKFIFYGVELNWVTFDNIVDEIKKMCVNHVNGIQLELHPDQIDGAIQDIHNHKTIMLIHSIFGINGESGELAQMLTNHLFGGHALDPVNVLEELGDTTWYVGIGGKAVDVMRFSSILWANFKKLTFRYGTEWTQGCAVRRDTTLERALLEEQYIGATLPEEALAQEIINGKQVSEKLWYIASPLAHKDPAIRTERVEQAKLFMQYMILKGHNVFSPIVHNISVSELVQFSWKWADWQDFDFNILSRCEGLIVLKLEGWEDSVGINGNFDIEGEIEFAERHGMEIMYCDPVSLDEVMAASRDRAVEKAGGALYKKPTSEGIDVYTEMGDKGKGY